MIPSDILDSLKNLNRRQRRRRIIDRTFTKKGYAYGMKIGGRKFNIKTHLVKKGKLNAINQ